MARGSSSPSSYVTAAGSSSVEESSFGVTFGREDAARSTKRSPCSWAMPRLRYSPFEHNDGGTGEGGDRPSSSGQLKACIICGITDTPLWRANDIDGEKNLCNACGVRQNRLKRARRVGDATPHSALSAGQVLRQMEGSTASPRATKRAASARLDRLPTMMCNAVPVSRAWSLGQLGDDMIGAWGPSFHPQACHSDPISFYSTRGIAIAFSEDKAVHGNGAQLSCSREVDPDLESDLDPLDPKFLARIHDPHQR